MISYNNTGDYISALTTKVNKIQKHKIARRIRSIIFLLLVIFVCVGGILLGVVDKEHKIEENYSAFVKTPLSVTVDYDLLFYKDVWELYEQYYLGNNVSQSLMGGYYCNKNGLLVRPDVEKNYTVVKIGEKESKLANSIASDVNVVDELVYYRDQYSKRVYSYDTTNNKTTMLDLKNVGQFIVFNKDYYYIDLNAKSLVHTSSTNNESKTLVEKDVKSFAIVGNHILYLSEDNILIDLNLSNMSKERIGSNVHSFTFSNGLWVQNNTSLYQVDLNDMRMTEYILEISCHKLLGTVSNRFVIDSNDGVYVYDVTNHNNKKLEGELFVSAYDNKALMYDINENRYYECVL